MLRNLVAIALLAGSATAAHANAFTVLHNRAELQITRAQAAENARPTIAPAPTRTDVAKPEAVKSPVMPNQRINRTLPQRIRDFFHGL